MDQQPVTTVSPKTFPTNLVAIIVAITYIATIVGGWLYIHDLQKQLKMKTEALQTRQASPSAPVAAAPVRPIFDPAVVRVGDKVGSWVVTNIAAAQPGSPREVTFSGSVEVSGVYAHFKDDEPFFADVTVFQATLANQLPVASTLMWPIGSSHGFIFEDASAAGKVFGGQGSTGSATIRISDYTVTLIEGEAMDHVRAFQVVSKKPETDPLSLTMLPKKTDVSVEPILDPAAKFKSIYTFPDRCDGKPYVLDAAHSAMFDAMAGRIGYEYIFRLSGEGYSSIAQDYRVTVLPNPGYKELAVANEELGAFCAVGYQGVTFMNQEWVGLTDKTCGGVADDHGLALGCETIKNAFEAATNKFR